MVNGMWNQYVSSDPNYFLQVPITYAPASADNTQRFSSQHIRQGAGL